MALGGGTFVTQNKVLPGSYMVFVSAARASAEVSDRGLVALPMELDWGVSGEVFTLEAADFQKRSGAMLGYGYTHEKLKPLRDLFLGARRLYCYRLNGDGVKATCAYGAARYPGVRGNDLKISIAVNVDNDSKRDVSTYLENALVDKQTVTTAADLVDNDFIVFVKNAELVETAGVPLENGTNGVVNGESHQKALDALESYSFNVLGCMSAEDTVKGLYVAYTARMRDEMGVKFQLVVHRKGANYEGVINVVNNVADEGAPAYALVPWTAGAEAGCPINRDLTNAPYTGEYTVNVKYTQSALETAIKAGTLIFHRVGDEVRVLDDINSFISFTTDKNADFSSNQTVRVIDAWANDGAALFNEKYLGKVQNNATGRGAFWGDLVTLARTMQDIEAIENFSADAIKVGQGEKKNSVVVNCALTVAGCMKQLYLTTIVG